MDTLRLDLTAQLRSFRLALALEVDGGTVALVGPSGAGKTTLLRAVAGLTRPDAGRISLGQEVWFDSSRSLDLPPEERSVGFVFQNYALFPHLTVEQNVGFAGKGRVAELLARFGIDDLAQARPAELSGGERQRVGLARALAREPKVLLMDEPLSALDPHTRAGVRSELQTLLRDLALPALVVTHDFEDAVALAGQVGVILHGRLLQLGTPAELVRSPSHPFVASLTGGNLLVGHATSRGDDLTAVELEDGTVVLSTQPGNGPVGVIVQPWEIMLSRKPAHDSALNHVRGTVTSVVPAGNRVRVRIGPLTADVTVASAKRLGLAEGEAAIAAFKATATRLIPLPSTRAQHPNSLLR
ncbi:MAG: ABC transporter ATP-binding protein [Actinobacteria bacterium]|nr:ABC transporter ATP-binding protein [Actinomycetota bacterium]